MTCLRVLLVPLLAMVVLCLAGSAQAADPSNLLLNGDFEITDGWGEIGSTDYPSSWTSQTYPGVGNQAAQQSGVNAIGGSGTSAHMKYVPSSPMGAISQAAIVSSGPLWQFDIDFVSGPIGSNRSFNLYLTSADDFYSKNIDLRVIAGSTGRGTVQIYDAGWQVPVGFADSVIIDDDVTQTPLVHHLRIVGDYSQETPTYDMYLTDSNDVLHSVTGLSSFLGGTPSQGEGITRVQIVQTNGSTSGDYVIDNVSLTSDGIYLLPGDANLDGEVNVADAALVAENWLSSDADWLMGDFNHDGIVNGIDATMLATNWQPAPSGAASVPEPSLLVMLVCAASCLCVTRKLRR